MQKIIEGSLEYLKFDRFDDQAINHCFTTRKGGVSQGCYASMNLGFFRCADEAKVEENFKIICEALEFDPSNCVLTDQTHTNNIARVTEAHKGYGFPGHESFENVDGLITNIEGIPLVSYYADCVPLFFYDPIKKVVGTAHAGWRGTHSRISVEMIDLFQQAYGSALEDIIVGIGPSIGKCCFEVDADVANEFYELETCYHKFIEKKANGKYHIDLKAINKLMFMNRGISSANIEVTDLCTKCDPETFFSHRAHGNARGNLSGIIGLR